jgi:hypothetical protein
MTTTGSKIFQVMWKAKARKPESIKVFIKQEVWTVNPVDSWMDISRKMAERPGMPMFDLLWNGRCAMIVGYRGSTTNGSLLQGINTDRRGAQRKHLTLPFVIILYSFTLLFGLLWNAPSVITLGDHGP